MSKEKPSKLDGWKERLDEWFGVEKKTLKEVQEQLRLDGCSVSLSRLSDWWSARQQWKQEDALLARIASGARQCKEVEKSLGQNPAPEFETLVKLHRVLILKLSTQGNADPEMLELVNRMMKPVVQFARLQQLETQNRIEERKLALMEQKAAQADQAKGLLENKELGEQERAARMREVFGIS